MIALSSLVMFSMFIPLFAHGPGMVRTHSGHTAVSVGSDGDIAGFAAKGAESAVEKAESESLFPHPINAADRSSFLDHVLDSFLKALPIEGQASVFDVGTSFNLLVRMARSSLIPALTGAQEKAVCKRTLEMKSAIRQDIADPAEMKLPALLRTAHDLNWIRSMIGEDDPVFKDAMAKLSSPSSRQRLAAYAREVAQIDAHHKGPPPDILRSPVPMINNLWSLHSVGVLDRAALDDISKAMYKSWQAFDVHDWTTTDYREFTYAVTHMILNDANWYQKVLEPGFCDSKYGSWLTRLQDLVVSGSLLSQIDVDQAAEIGIVLRQCRLEDDARFTKLTSRARDRVFDFARANRKGPMSHFLCGPKDWIMDCVHSSYVSLISMHGKDFHLGPDIKCSEA